MSLMSMFPGGGGTNNQPLKAPTNFLVSSNTPDSVMITWTDPENEYSQPSGVLIGEWMFTRIVRKIGSAPVNANDGVIVLESAVKNQHQTTPYIDSDLVQGTKYYYAAFAFTKTRVSSPGAFYEFDLKGYDAILNNNSWSMIRMAAEEGVASSIWSKGDIKTETINGTPVEFEILGFNATSYTCVEGGHPGILFGTKNIISTRLSDSRVPRSYSIINSHGVTEYIELGYGNWDVASYVNSYYNSFPKEMRNSIPLLSLSFTGVDTEGGQVYDDVRQVRLYVPRQADLSSYYPTQSSRVKNYNGSPYPWFVAIFGRRTSSVTDDVFAARNITSSGELNDFLDDYNTAGVSFMFGIGKVGG